jgi:hypothetical protein
MDQTLVSWVIVLLEVIEKPPPLSYKFKEASAGMMIPNMNLKMFREVVDALAEQRYLNLWGTGISLMESELLNNLPPLLLNNCHVFSVSLLLSFFIFFFLSHCQDLVKENRLGQAVSCPSANPCRKPSFDPRRTKGIDDPYIKNDGKHEVTLLWSFSILSEKKQLFPLRPFMIHYRHHGEDFLCLHRSLELLCLVRRFFIWRGNLSLGR